MRRHTAPPFGVLLSVVPLVSGCGTRRPHLPNEKCDRNLTNLRLIDEAVQSYHRVYKRWPSDLREAMFGRHWTSGDWGYYLLHPSIPVIPGSDPPASYRYVQPDDATLSKAILVYPNIRDDPELLVIVRVDGTLDGLTPEDYERELRAMGVDYDSLPMPGRLTHLWIGVGVGVAAGVAAILVLVIRLLKGRVISRESDGE